ncbi:U-box domain-containing protein 43 [Cryptomeria japonica]|uniref:U-box domain-containing protein 43 n=1 Tax=Cryptomeria japonica TaxID=3369 RepID=UPI0027D9D1BA|nr:U-box domain-containing protein 43 [Cryptomeria japonica]XP_057817725.2 U-box domain-containing protein 43 [Cryptomeria japonica]XP_057817726.2 U-box domain-containing protein 43 [Cryptomeria japonica]
MTLILELVPIGTLLAFVTTQVLETAVAAQDVLIEKESFRVLSKYLLDIQPVLAELRMRDLKETEAARQALQSLSDDVKAADSLVSSCRTKPKFWLLVNCRDIVKRAQQVTRDIGKSLALLSLASTEVSADIRDNVNRLQGEMQNAEFEASQSQLRIIDKLELGLREHKTDQGFANDLIREIARAVGVPVEPSEINKELESFRREKEEAAVRKEREEEAFMEQVIALLSHADAANSPEQVEKRYRERLMSLGSNMPEKEDIPPLKSFICPLKDDVMMDPVSLSTGTTYERKEIQQWFEAGNKIDPDTREPLLDFTLRPNIPLKQSIEEWVELNYCLKIKAAKPKLQSRVEAKEKDALKQMQQLCEEKSINKDWIAIEGLIPLMVQVLIKSHSRDVKRAALSTLKTLVIDHTENKDKVVDAGGVEQVVRCLARDARISTVAVELLSELLLNGSELNVSVYRKISLEKSAILLLVTLRNGSVTESAEKAEAILQRLRDNDDNIVQMAAANWYGPLIECLHKGSEGSKLKMAIALSKMELTDQNIKLLGDEGAIPPLVKMISSNLESKAAALGALKNLSTNHENKKHIANAGAVPLILDHLVTSKFPSNIRETSAIILERIMCDDGVQFLVDENAEPLVLEPIIQNLLALQQNPSTFFSIRRHVLNALLGMLSGPDGENVRSVARSANGISVLLPLIEGSDQKIRESVIKLLCSLSEGGSQEISHFLLNGNKFELFVTFLEDDSRGDIQAAAAGILSTLPASDGKVTDALIKAEALPAIIQVLNNGSPNAKENAVGVLLRFTDPSSLETQHMVVHSGAFPLLVNLLYSGTILAKSRAAFAIGNLSLSTARLSVAPTVNGCWCFKPVPPPVCRVHLGPCDVKTTFCLVKADALPGLVNLLQEREGKAAGATIYALATLVSDDDILNKGASVLHEAKAIDHILEILSQGTPESKEEAVKILEKVFQVKEIVEAYGSKARIPLVDLTTQTHGNGTLRRKAAKVLAQLEVIQETSTYF